MGKYSIISLSIKNIKTMTKSIKNNRQKSFRSRRKLAVVSTLAIIGVLVVGNSIVTNIVQADSYDAQIKALQQENATNSSAVADLASQASSYQDAINRLQSEISATQAIIDSNIAKQADLQHQIDANQAELDKQKLILGQDIKMSYVDGQPTTIEMLASSKDLSEFVDKEEYRNAVQSKIQTTLKKIADLQNQLKDQKTQVENLIDSQKQQQAKLASAQAEQAKLLAYNQSQQDAYNQKTKANQAKIADLRAQQAAENAKLLSGGGSYLVAGDSGHGGYPAQWDAPVGQDTVLDNWGMYNRECVSYTAWRVYSSGRNMPYWGGYGNANQWDDNARAAGIPVDSNPRPGDVAIKNAGTYGHAMYVEHVYADGSIYISQYNQDYTGHYSEAYISASSVRANGLVFIHFP